MNPLTDLNIHVSLHQSKGYALLLGTMSIMTLIVTPVVQTGLATTMIAIGMVYAGAVIYRNPRQIDISILFFLFPYLMYVFWNGSGESRLLSIAIIVHLAAISTGAIDAVQLRKVLVGVAMAAAILTICQQLSFIVTGIKTQFLLNPFLIPAHRMPMHESFFSAKLSDGMYRPSAFFEEPAHMSQYCVIGLCACIFNKTAQIKKAMLISFGIFASTSGMGMVLVFAIWAWWALSLIENQSLSKKVSIFICVFVGLILIYLLLKQIPFFEKIISRFVDTPDGQYNALRGRTFGWDILFADKSFEELFWGSGPENLPKFYLTGFLSELYKYGWAGIIMLFTFLARLIYGTTGLARTTAIIWTSLYFIAGVSGFLPVIFYSGVAIAFNYDNKHNIDIE